jgi:D,D-heptose 1,7-bisphosphate phosphatase
VEKDFKEGTVHGKNLVNKQRAVFIDRDGTINKYVGFLTDIEDFELIDGVTDAIKKINSSGYLAIVVTNQPVVARGEVSFSELDQIHNKMETLLGKEGAYLDAIYYCPHHPHKGYEGEVEELKIDCECRKPKPGMLLKAAGDFNIDLTRSWMIGDGENDIKAGNAAGCRTILIGDNNFGQDIDAQNLYDAVNKCMDISEAKV